MAHNRNTNSESNKQILANVFFPANSPVNTKTLKEGYMLDKFGNLVSITKKSEESIEGDIIDLQKRHYDNATIKELLDRGFSELLKTNDKIVPDSFFNLYQEIFYNIPKEGKKSHTFLIEESTKYIGGYEDPKDDKIDDLINNLIEIETSQIITPPEHPLFRNGIALRSPSDQLGIMQEGHLRRVSNYGSNPSPYQQLKRTLGLINPLTGKPLDDENSWTKVSEQTWNSLPKWPNGTLIDDKADFNLTLASFNVAASNITLLTEIVNSTEIDQLEINFLIKLLQKKTPFGGDTIEDIISGNVNYSTTDLLPFGTQGTHTGEIKIYYTGEGNYGNAREQRAQSLLDNVITKWRQYPYNNDDKQGIYGVNIEDIADNRSRGTLNKRTKYNIPSVEYVGHIRTGVNYTHTDYKSRLIDQLEDLRFEINSKYFKRYTWNIDPTRDITTTIDGITTISGKHFWTLELEDSYIKYMNELINMEIGKEIEKFKYFSDLEELYKYEVDEHLGII
jgi:hypothetical protein